MSNETEFNQVRHDMVKDVIELHGGPITIERIAAWLPNDFELGLDDLAPFLNEQAPTDIEFEGDEPATAETPATVPVEAAPIVEATAEPEAPPPPTQEEIEAAVIRRNAADQALANRRAELIVAQGAERVTRDKLAKAIQTFQAGTPFKPMTRDELIRSHLAAESALRQVRKNQGAPAPRIGRSAVDRVAYYSKFGGGPGAGGGRAYARGAAPSQAKGAPNFDPRRGPTVKLPSQV